MGIAAVLGAVEAPQDESEVADVAPADQVEQGCRFHATRHTAATMLLESGVPLEVVSAILGHSSLSVTADVCAQVTQDAKWRALEKLDGGQ